LLERLLIIGAFFYPITLALANRPTRFYSIFFYADVSLYAIQGQFYQPNYWLALIELNTIFPTIFIVKRRTLILLYSLSLVIFNYVFILNSEKFIGIGLLSKNLVGDVVIGITIITFLSIIYYNSYISIRTQKDQINQRFTNIGKSFTFILHDIKGMISSLVVYAEILRDWVKIEKFPSKEKEILSYLSEDIFSLEALISDVNKLISSEFSDEPVHITINEVISSIKLMLKSRLAGIQVILDGDINIKTKPYLLIRILMNSFNNSIDEIKNANISQGKITVTCQENSLEIRDNSGKSLDKSLLKSLNRPFISITTKKTGSGLGTYIMKNDVASMEGTIEFINEPSGLAIRIILPKKICKKIKKN
jgi:signal transduction histidine kinase